MDKPISRKVNSSRRSAPGRQRFQKIYVRKSGAGGKTTALYKPEEDAPAANNLVSILPTKEKIESRAETMEFLVVGLVLAGNLLQYSTQGSSRSRDKKGDEERAARGVLAAERNVLRAIVPTTEFISTSSIKYYVASCMQPVARSLQHASHYGRCHLLSRDLG